MSRIQPKVDLFTGTSLAGRHGVLERSRLEWRSGDPGDPAALAEAFLKQFGLGLPRTQESSESEHIAQEICGAAVFVSSVAGAVMSGAPVGAPTPCPAVPDLAVVVYAHSEHDAVRRVDVGGHGSGHRGSGHPGDWRMGPWRASSSPEEYAAAVEQVRTAIAQGDVYQVNLVGHAAAAYVGDPMPALRRVTRLPGARYPGILSGDGWAIASASPETLVRVEGNAVETRPIKGTRAATAKGRRELLASAKERAEHIMIVDLERNDLAHVAETGTVIVPELFVLRRWCDLWQAESRVVARLAGGVDLAGLLRAVCPGGSVTGAPKLAALAQIAALEPVGRGASMGALGWLDHRRLDLGLTIRTVAVDGERVHLWAGGGITWDSEPYAEVAEAADKAAPLRAALAADHPKIR